MLAMTGTMGFSADDEQPEDDTVSLTLQLAAPAHRGPG